MSLTASTVGEFLSIVIYLNAVQILKIRHTITRLGKGKRSNAPSPPRPAPIF